MAWSWGKNDAEETSIINALNPKDALNRIDEFLTSETALNDRDKRRVLQKLLNRAGFSENFKKWKTDGIFGDLTYKDIANYLDNQPLKLGSLSEWMKKTLIANNYGDRMTAIAERHPAAKNLLSEKAQNKFGKLTEITDLDNLSAKKVRELQTHLYIAGLYKGKIDGDAGRQTKAAFGEYLAGLKDNEPVSRGMIAKTNTRATLADELKVSDAKIINNLIPKRAINEPEVNLPIVNRDKAQQFNLTAGISPVRPAGENSLVISPAIPEKLLEASPSLPPLPAEPKGIALNLKGKVDPKVEISAEKLKFKESILPTAPVPKTKPPSIFDVPERLKVQVSPINFTPTLSDNIPGVSLTTMDVVPAPPLTTKASLLNMPLPLPNSFKMASEVKTEHTGFSLSKNFPGGVFTDQLSKSKPQPSAFKLGLKLDNGIAEFQIKENKTSIPAPPKNKFAPDNGRAPLDLTAGTIKSPLTENPMRMAAVENPNRGRQIPSHVSDAAWNLVKNPRAHFDKASFGTFDKDIVFLNYGHGVPWGRVGATGRAGPEVKIIDTIGPYIEQALMDRGFDVVKSREAGAVFAFKSGREGVSTFQTFAEFASNISKVTDRRVFGLSIHADKNGNGMKIFSPGEGYGKGIEWDNPALDPNSEKLKGFLKKHLTGFYKKDPEAHTADYDILTETAKLRGSKNQRLPMILLEMGDLDLQEKELKEMMNNPEKARDFASRVAAAYAEYRDSLAPAPGTHPSPTIAGKGSQVKPPTGGL